MSHDQASCPRAAKASRTVPEYSQATRTFTHGVSAYVSSHPRVTRSSATAGLPALALARLRLGLEERVFREGVPELAHRVVVDGRRLHAGEPSRPAAICPTA